MYHLKTFLLCSLTLSLLSSCSTFRNLEKKMFFTKKDYVVVDLDKGESIEEHHATSAKNMIASQGKFSTKAGLKMFDLGGNIVDAAVAISFALAVERPQSTGIGGGGFLLYLPKDKSVPITMDFREKAPLAAKKDMYSNEAGEIIPGMSLNGIFSVGVPGFVAGLLELHANHGKLSLLQVLKPAIDLADGGFPVYPELKRALEYREKVLAQNKEAHKIFFKENKILTEGELLVQKDLAKTLKLIALHGSKVFYQGSIARKIVKESKVLGGLLSLADLKKYNVKYRDPIVGEYKGHKIYSMSPPSSGGAHVVQILKILKNDDLKSYGPQHEKTVHLTSSAMQQAFADRAAYMGDSDFADVPLDVILLDKYAKDVRFGISESKALRKIMVSEASLKRYRPKYEEKYDPTEEVGSEKKLYQEFNPYRKMREKAKQRRLDDQAPKKVESSETTHFSIMDSEGNVISSTQTINGYFGSGVVVPGTGIILNNEMDDFASGIGERNLFGAIGGKNNLIEPEKRPLSSMSPTIVVKDKKPMLAIGSPSGTRILTCVTLSLLNYLEHDIDLYDSVAMTRYHHQWDPDEIRLDEKGLPKKTIKNLKRFGHQLNFKNLGCRIQAVAKEGGILIGVSDPRGYGLSKGQE